MLLVPDDAAEWFQSRVLTLTVGLNEPGRSEAADQLMRRITSDFLLIICVKRNK